MSIREGEGSRVVPVGKGSRKSWGGVVPDAIELDPVVDCSSSCQPHCPTPHPTPPKIRCRNTVAADSWLKNPPPPTNPDGWGRRTWQLRRGSLQKQPLIVRFVPRRFCGETWQKAGLGRVVVNVFVDVGILAFGWRGRFEVAVG